MDNGYHPSLRSVPRHPCEVDMLVGIVHQHEEIVILPCHSVVGPVGHICIHVAKVLTFPSPVGDRASTISGAGLGGCLPGCSMISLGGILDHTCTAFQLFFAWTCFPGTTSYNDKSPDPYAVESPAYCNSIGRSYPIFNCFSAASTLSSFLWRGHLQAVPFKI